MKDNFTSINVIIDASGSMTNLRNDTIGSFNTFLKEQKEVPGEAVFTLCTFNDEATIVHDFVKIADVSNLDHRSYYTSGNTALLDALGSTIDSVGRKLAALPEEERPNKVIVLVQTDGHENASKTYTKDQIKSMVEHQQSVYSWSFVFVGANIDAITAGTSLGFTASNSVGYNATKGGTHSLYSSISTNTSALRSSKLTSTADFFGQTGVTPTSPATPVVPTTPATPNTDNNSNK